VEWKLERMVSGDGMRGMVVCDWTYLGVGEGNVGGDR
jgi:hypothetical protein